MVRSPIDSNELGCVTVMNLQTWIQQNLYAIQDKDMEKGGNTRDNQMAKNLEWLVNHKYPNQKLIVWAASFHIIKESSTSINKGYSNHHSMGEKFADDSLLAADTYVLGFSSDRGHPERLLGNFRILLMRFVNCIKRDLKIGYLKK